MSGYRKHSRGPNNGSGEQVPGARIGSTHLSLETTLNSSGNVKTYARIIASALVSAALLYIASLDGGLNRFTYDSYRYLAGAESILQSGSYLDTNGEPQRVWPPGTSLLLAGIMLVTGLDYSKSTLVLSFISTLFASIALWTILQRAIVRQWLIVTAFSVFVLNIGLLSAQHKLLSDGMALALTLASLSCAIAAVNLPNTRWYSLFLTAVALISIAIVFRFASLATVPVLCAVGLWCSFRKRSHWEAMFLPILSPALVLLCFVLLGVPVFGEGRVVGFQMIDLSDDFDGLLHIFNQFLPVRFMPESAALVLYFLLLVVAPGLSIIIIKEQKKRSTLAVLSMFHISFWVFVMLSQSIAAPSFTTDFRILAPLIPMSIVLLAVTADALLSCENLAKKAVSLFFVCVLAISAARTVRAATLNAFVKETATSSQCISRQQLAEHIQRNVTADGVPAVLSNSQGQAWFALRTPIKPLTLDNLKQAPVGSLVLVTKMASMCAYVEKFGDYDENTIYNVDFVEFLDDFDLFLLFRRS